MEKARRVLIDADGCPRQVLAIAEQLCSARGLVCLTFASYNHQYDRPDHIVVDASPQAVDIRLVNESRSGDIVITQDIGLAALVLAKGAKAISVHGQIFTPERMLFQLEQRSGQARFRRGGGRTKGPSARTAEDDKTFANALQSLLDA